MARTPPPLSSFLPELIAVWSKAALGPVTLTTPDRSSAIRMRYRLYSLRKSMQHHGHEAYASAAHATISIREAPGGKWEVLIRPADQDLRSMVKEAGIEVEEAPEIDFGELEDFENNG